VGPIDRFTWLAKLAEKLIYNAEVTDQDAGIEAEDEGGDVDLHGNLHY
jgi:hypothetical protein